MMNSLIELEKCYDRGLRFDQMTDSYDRLDKELNRKSSTSFNGQDSEGLR